MNVEFNWSSQPTVEDREIIETEIGQRFQSTEFRPCHSGTILVFLGIGGPLNRILTGSIRCQCGKVFATFRGNSDASKLDLFKI
jgi:hypothetical protein